jgi:GDPmannose 4,6-dehydratase
VRALITGAGGQDGSYLAEQLVAAGHDVVGVVRRAGARQLPANGVNYVHLDLTDERSVAQVLSDVQPDEIYHLAAVTAPGGAWGTASPAGLVETNAQGVVNLLEAVPRFCRTARVVHASSSAVYDPHRYGLYGVSKRFAHDAVVGYRAGHGLHVSNAVLYSHTSPRQDPRFLAPTIARTFRALRDGGTEKLVLTDLLGRRDWGHAADVMAALPLLARADTPGDYDVATGVTHSVREFVDVALEAAELTWEQAVQVYPGNPAPAERPADIAALRDLGWKPATSFEAMVREMVWTSPS